MTRDNKAARKGPKPKRERPVITLSLTVENRNYVRRAAGQANITVSRLIDSILDAYRAKVGAK